MNRADLVRAIEEVARRMGTVAVWTEGARHSKVRIGSRVATVPRHREINEVLAKVILRQLGGR